MKPLLETPQEFNLLNEELRKCVSQLLEALKIEKQSIIVKSGYDFANESDFQDSLVVLTDGNLIYERLDRQIFSYEPGDIVGIERLFKSASKVKISSISPVTVDIYPANQFFSALMKNPTLLDTWSEILVLMLELYASIISSLALVKLKNANPKKYTVSAGDTIVREGESGSEVFYVIEGKANVSINGSKVGDIHKDEVFGVLAALGGVPRTATVTADTECQILVVEKTDFAELIKAKPEAFEKVMQDTARAIRDLNLSVSKLGGERINSI